MKKVLQVVMLVFVVSFNYAFATTYYTKTSGALNTLTNWNSDRDGTSGSAPSNFTTAGDVFIIQGTGGGSGAPHAMTLSTTMTIGSSSNNTKLIIEGGASLTATSALTFASAAQFQIDDGGTYSHNHSGAFTSIFGGTESFAANSNFVIGGSASPGTGPTSSQVTGGFGNFTFSTTSTTTMQCNDVFPNVKGNFTKSSTGAEFRMAASTAGNGGFTIDGDFTLSGGIFSFGNGSVAPSITVKGNFTISAGTFQQAVTGGTSGSNTICNVNFDKGGVQTFTKSGGTITAATSSFRRIRFIVKNGTTLDMGTNVLDCAGSTACDFIVENGATVRLGDVDGIVLEGTSATTGNIRTSSASLRTFNTGANYEYTGSAAQVTGTGLPSTVNNLVINNNAGVTLTNDVTVGGTLTLTNGKLTLGSNNLQAGTISGGSSSVYVVATGSGELRKTVSATGSFTLPIGDASNYSPATINITAADGFSSAYVGAKVTAAKHPENESPSHYLNRYWTVNASGITNPVYSATFTYVDGDINGTEGNIYLGKYNGSSWSIFDAANTSANTLSGSGMTTFSDFTGGENGFVPVELVSFTAAKKGNNVELNWKTATESNTAGFEIERAAISNQSSVNSWHKVGFVEGAGTSSSTKNYSFTDKAGVGTFLYRLKQIDRNGSFTYSHTVEVSLGVMPSVMALASNYPNPFNPSTEIRFTLSPNMVSNSNAGKIPVTLKVYDALGREVATLVNEEKEAGTYFVTFNAKGLSSGVYYYKLNANDYSIVNKMMLAK